MEEHSHRHRSRIVAVVAATLVSLACGTNYAYSAWGPQFAERLKLSATESNLLGAAGNVGMYASGVPFGHMIDTRGPRPGVALGGILIGTGYVFIKKAFDEGQGSMSLPILCFFSFLTGCGSCSAFQGAIKTSALNWPDNRGTATAFPLSAFGLSAVFFVALSSLVFPDSSSNLLLFLALGTFILILGPLAFIRVPDSNQYKALASSRMDEEPRRDSNQLQRTAKYASSRTRGSQSSREIHDDAQEESDSLLSDGSEIRGPLKSQTSHVYHHAEVTGHHLLRIPEFYRIFLLMGSLTGIGLMTINNIGNDAKALWLYHDPSTPKSYISRRQLFHVSIISVFSFLGRLCSGMGSDVLVKRLHTSRYWCLVASSLIFALAQCAAIKIEPPQLLVVVSALSGLAYGALFGVSPSLVADAFGVSGLAMNWGIMTLGPIIFGNIFNIVYGRIYDYNSVVEHGERMCEEGIGCYRSAYYVTLAVSSAALGLSLWCAWRDHTEKRRVRAETEERDEHIA